MHVYLALQNTYDTVQIGLFQDNVLVDFHEVHKHHLSKDFILLVLGLLRHHKVQFKDLSFIGVNVGPSPFTTIRALLAAVNGINFAINLPLVPVDGLLLLAKSENDSVPTGI